METKFSLCKPMTVCLDIHSSGTCSRVGTFPFCFFLVHFHKTNKQKNTHKKKQKHERWWKWRLISRRVSITLRKWPWRWKSPPPLVGCLELLWCEVMDVSHHLTHTHTHINTRMFSGYFNRVRERDECGNINRTDCAYRVGGNEFALLWAAGCWWHIVIRGIIPFPSGVSLLFVCVDRGVPLMQRGLKVRAHRPVKHSRWLALCEVGLRRSQLHRFALWEDDYSSCSDWANGQEHTGILRHSFVPF